MAQRLAGLAGQVFDVVVIGGGINGASAAREAALAGYSVLLVERGDYGSGSTSRSSRLLHCGLRYLAPGGPMSAFLLRPKRLAQALRTVRRSMRTRAELVGELGGRLRPVTMQLPIYSDGPYRPWQLDAAFTLLKGLGEGGVPLDYRRLPAAQALEELPFAPFLRDRDRLLSVAVYTEYQFDWPERLAVDLALELQRLGAAAFNYTAVTDFTAEGEGWRVTLADESATGGGGRARADVRCRALLNFAGPWIDEVNDAAEARVRRTVDVTKGAHVVVRLPEAFRGQGLMAMTSDGHPFYCFPWRDAHFFGPTETAYDGDRDRVRASDGDIEQLLGLAGRELPGLFVERRHILYSWAGLRPLTHDPGTFMGLRNRTLHDLGPVGGPPFLALTNGSLGAHRSTGRDVLAALGRRLAPSGPPRRGGGLAKTGPLAAELGPSEWLRIARDEQVVHLGDLLWARSGKVWDVGHGSALARSLAALVGSTLGWEQERQDREVELYLDEVRNLL
ncbi:Glycerol-3-phosphate dehydrogenase [Tistlia consotensis]|uniref:Glycerol-3-phosphate dehydrogenase n=1 Tax=Tistlia consotensis USBA 355 TaxID=560819 RepID=A0A1Y6BYW1_9PROT|nr:FAD-dependent oxidoreductase [Tistlia consotensis]SMF36509.1 Glycerol-3-phosphate dehydrogenase [Tistlia consotensis USBA 355]SNR72027.1 Glycerol-3-phosphate dehydrogenase [Tistlia consotensis]